MASYAGMEDEGGEASLADILIWLAIFAYAPCLYGSYGIWQSTASISRTRFDDPWVAGLDEAGSKIFIPCDSTIGHSV
jgi:hypothetical protein